MDNVVVRKRVYSRVCFNDKNSIHLPRQDKSAVTEAVSKY